MKARAGRLGELVLRVGELVVGPDMGSVADSAEGTVRYDGGSGSGWDKKPTDLQRAQVKRELTENW